MSEEKPEKGEAEDDKSNKVSDSELYYDRLEMGRCYGISSNDRSAPVASDNALSQSAGVDSATSNTKRKTSIDRKGLPYRYETTDTTSEFHMDSRLGSNEDRIVGQTDVAQSAAAPSSNMAAKPLESQPSTDRYVGYPPRSSPLVGHSQQSQFPHIPSARHRPAVEREGKWHDAAVESSFTARHTERRKTQQQERQQYLFQLPFERDSGTLGSGAEQGSVGTVERSRKHSSSESKQAADSAPSLMRRPIVQRPPPFAAPQVGVLPASSPSTDEDADSGASGPTAALAASTDKPDRRRSSSFRSSSKGLRSPATSGRVTSEENEGDLPIRSARWTPRSSPAQQRGGGSSPPDQTFRPRIDSRAAGMGQSLSPAQFRATRHAISEIPPSHDWQAQPSMEGEDDDDDQ